MEAAQRCVPYSRHLGPKPARFAPPSPPIPAGVVAAADGTNPAPPRSSQYFGEAVTAPSQAEWEKFLRSAFRADEIHDSVEGGLPHDQVMALVVEACKKRLEEDVADKARPDSQARAMLRAVTTAVTRASVRDAHVNEGCPDSIREALQRALVRVPPCSRAVESIILNP